MAAGRTSSRSRIDAPLRYWGLGSIPVRKPLLPGFGCSEGVWVALNGLEVMRPFWAKLTMV